VKPLPKVARVTRIVKPKPIPNEPLMEAYTEPTDPGTVEDLAPDYGPGEDIDEEGGLPSEEEAVLDVVEHGEQLFTTGAPEPIADEDYEDESGLGLEEEVSPEVGEEDPGVEDELGLDDDSEQEPVEDEG
jgi:hypothetical protein